MSDKDLQNIQAFVSLLPKNWQATVLAIITVIIFLGFLYKTFKAPLTAVIRWMWGSQSPQEREWVGARHKLADALFRQIESDNDDHGWETWRFIGLNAEYYEGNRPSGGFLRGLLTPLSIGPRRITAVARELRAPRDRFSVIEGDPGSGKSVLLREVALEVLKRAEKSRALKIPTALYVNLKMLERPADHEIDAHLIRKFAIQQLTQGSPEIERILNLYFDDGLRNGWWFFLLDSFDEIPEVLSSEDTSKVIDKYSRALQAFATGHSCCTILASRQFRRPKDKQLARYRILPLSDRQRDELIGKANLTPEAAQRLYKGLALAGPSLQHACENPMYLGLLIDLIRSGASTPPSAHELLQHFIDERLAKNGHLLDEVRIDAQAMHAFAQRIAFQITALDSLGLNPTRSALLAAVDGDPHSSGPEHRQLDALQKLHLSRGEPKGHSGPSRFTFAHRRIQEFFATCYVRRVPDALPAEQLLIDARWRETATVLLAGPHDETTDATFDNIRRKLKTCVAVVRENLQYAPVAEEPDTAAQRPPPERFLWPEGALHLLSILNDSFADDPSRLPEDIRALAADVVRSAFQRGSLEDRRLALEVASPLTATELMPLLRNSIASGSRILDDAAFRQIGSQQELPDDLSRWLRLELVLRAFRGEIARNRRSLSAFLARIHDGNRLQNAASLAGSIFGLDMLVRCMLAVVPFTLCVLFPEEFASWLICIVWLLGSIGTLPRRLWRAYSNEIASSISRRATYMEHLEKSLNSTIISTIVFRLILLLILPSRLEALIPYPFVLVMETLYIIWALWLPFAFWAVIDGFFVSWSWRPFLSFYPLLCFVVKPRLALVLVPVIIVVVAIVLLISRINFHGLGTKLDALEPVMKPVLLVLFLGFCVAIVAEFPRFLRDSMGDFILQILWCRDLLRFWTVQRRPVSIAPTDFLSSLGAYHTNSIRLRFIRLIFSNDLLIPNEHALDIICNITIALDRDLKASVRTSSATGCKLVDEWERDYCQRFHWGKFARPRLRDWGQETLDQLAMLERRVREQCSIQPIAQAVRRE